MAYNDLMLELPKFFNFIEHELKNSVSATENSRDNLSIMLNNMAELDTDQKNALTSNGQSVFTDRLQLKNKARSMFERSWAPAIAVLIGSASVAGGGITDFDLFWTDWRAFVKAADEHVTPRAVSYASDPAAQNGDTTLIRLTEGPGGDKIESGRHDEVVKVAVDSKPAAGRVQLLVNNSNGPVDELDYKVSNPSPVAIELINEVFLPRDVTNPFFNGNSDSDDNATVTVMTGWDLSIVNGTPIMKIAKAIADGELWRSRPNGFSIGSAAGSEQQIKRRIPSNVLNSNDPRCPAFPVRLPSGSTWTGNITITWGSKTQVFTQADLSAGNWVNLIVDRDADIYPENFDSAEPYWQVNIETTGGGGDEIIFVGFLVTGFVKRHSNFYAGFSGNTDPKFSDTWTGWTDSCTFAGVIQDILGFIYDDEESFSAYLPSTGTTNKPVDP